MGGLVRVRVESWIVGVGGVRGDRWGERRGLIVDSG